MPPGPLRRRGRRDGEGNKDGSYYVVDRDSGSLVWKAVEQGNGNVQDSQAIGGFIGNTAVALLDNPDQLALLRQDVRHIPTAIEEGLRYNGPAKGTMRVAAGDMEIRGASIKNGDRVLLWMAAANRDPEKFAAPDTFDVTRSPNPHLTFSHGIHFCMGAPLARLELEVALTHILRRFPKLTLAGPDGKPLIETDLTGIFGLQESLSYESAVVGTYQLVVRANGAAVESGPYEARLDVKASASLEDRKRITGSSFSAIDFQATRATALDPVRS